MCSKLPMTVPLCDVKTRRYGELLSSLRFWNHIVPDRSALLCGRCRANGSNDFRSVGEFEPLRAVRVVKTFALAVRRFGRSNSNDPEQNDPNDSNDPKTRTTRDSERFDD